MQQLTGLHVIFAFTGFIRVVLTILNILANFVMITVKFYVHIYLIFIVSFIIKLFDFVVFLVLRIV